MRAVLVKVGALLAPDQFRVALGDKKTERRALEEEQSDKEGVATARADNHGGQREGEKEDSGGKCENRDATHHSAPADGTAVGSVSSVGGDSEYSGVVGLEEGVDGEEVDREGKRGGEKWYEVMKEQVKSHKEDIGTDDDTDRLVHAIHYLCSIACMRHHCMFTHTMDNAGVGSGQIWLSWEGNVKSGMWPMLLPSSASYMMTRGGQVYTHQLFAVLIICTLHACTCL